MVFRMTRIVGRRSSPCSHVIKGSESETGPCRSLRKRPLVYGRDEGALNSIISTSYSPTVITAGLQIHRQELHHEERPSLGQSLIHPFFSI